MVGVPLPLFYVKVFENKGLGLTSLIKSAQSTDSIGCHLSKVFKIKKIASSRATPEWRISSEHARAASICLPEPYPVVDARRRCISCMGGIPKKRWYSLLNWLGLSYPTSKAALAASSSLVSIFCSSALCRRSSVHQRTSRRCSDTAVGNGAPSSAYFAGEQQAFVSRARSASMALSSLSHSSVWRRIWVAPIWGGITMR